MTTPTFTWSVANLERHTADGIVYTAHWTVNATLPSTAGAEGTEPVSAGAYGSVGLTAPAEGDTVIPYENLTFETVVSWVKDALGGEEKVAEIEAALTAQIEEKLTPTSASGAPW